MICVIIIQQQIKIREPAKPSTSTNPSKRHRERLNGELETVAQLLPYDSPTLSRLDKLSVLRLAVSFLQVKAHFNACLHSDAFLAPLPLAYTHMHAYRPTPLPYPGIPSLVEPRSRMPMVDAKESDYSSLALKALGGFILILNDNGEIYYASENVEQFLGFHQSDILHQPLYDLIHSEDREDIRQQLDPNLGNQEPFNPSSFTPDALERSVNARFRCLLDNTCGFLRMDVRGRLIGLHGLPSSYIAERGGPTNSNGQGALLGLLAVCTPFVPPSSSEMPAEELILKTKHHLDATLISMDERMFSILELDESDLPVSFYSIVHPEDASSLTEAHKEVLKSGSSGLLIYRLLARHSGREYFVQSSARMFYKNGKMDSIGLTHRVLNEVEGTMLLEKRSSLKAKLLSFDDSLLQSPRTLQSTAALPVPATNGCITGMMPGPSSLKSDEQLENEQDLNPFLLPPCPSTSGADPLQPWMMPGAILDWPPMQQPQPAFGTAAAAAFGADNSGYAFVPHVHFDAAAAATAAAADSAHFALQPHPPIGQLWQHALPHNAGPLLDATATTQADQIEYLNKPMLPPAEYLQHTGKNPLDFISEATNALLGQ
ncbi:ahr-1 [Pristionchus pacificus]|uniref:Ahr-1 n=1 Tax=Pristionchus pacificus TaxID=54126 RepID=A0A2A6BLX5_PRIPA|nr:ahr-1 [Pristionchus pacificus]|eukprot:PDM66907.1 ahr-1 [Pristionchus pacificus]